MIKNLKTRSGIYSRVLDIMLSEIIQNKEYQDYLSGRWLDNEFGTEFVGIDKEKRELSERLNSQIFLKKK